MMVVSVLNARWNGLPEPIRERIRELTAEVTPTPSAQAFGSELRWDRSAIFECVGRSVHEAVVQPFATVLCRRCAIYAATLLKHTRVMPVWRGDRGTGKVLRVGWLGTECCYGCARGYDDDPEPPRGIIVPPDPRND